MMKGGFEVKPSEAEKVLSVHEITKTYPGVTALRTVSMSFYPGEIHALAGENGAGKSTLIQVISGAIAPDAGRIEMDDVSYKRLTPRQAREMGIRVIYQESSLIPDMSVAENVFLGQVPGNRFFVEHRLLEKKTEEIFARLGIDLDPGVKAGSLNPARCQMVELARVISQDMKLLILDEPTASLTGAEVKILFRILRQLREKGISILYITHRLNEIYELADRITVMRDGSRIAEGDTKKIDRDTLVYLMAGRKLLEAYPKRTVLPGETALRIEHLSRGIVRDVSFELKKGEILGIAGLTGSGRTEAMQLLFGAEKKEAGQFELNGKKVEIHSPKEAVELGIGYLPKDRKQKSVLRELSVKENISLPILKRISSLFWIRQKEEASITEQYQNALRIKTPSIGQLVRNLSGGNQQKVVLSKWLASDSRILIFDEPTQGIDAGAKYEIYQMMNQLTERGISILMISSDMEELLGMSDRILIFYEGRISGELKERGEFTQERVLRYASNYGGMEAYV